MSTMYWHNCRLIATSYNTYNISDLKINMCNRWLSNWPMFLND